MPCLKRLHRTPLYRKNFFKKITNDTQAMTLALELADIAAYWHEVPVGALVLDAQNRVIGMGVNQTIYAHDPTAHAEIVALRDASAFIGNYRLAHCKLYVTLEPCMMCMGAIIQARIKNIVYGAKDPKTGVCESALNHLQYQQINHQTEISGGVMSEQSALRLSRFFRQRRQKVKQPSTEFLNVTGSKTIDNEEEH